MNAPPMLFDLKSLDAPKVIADVDTSSADKESEVAE